MGLIFSTSVLHCSIPPPESGQLRLLGSWTQYVLGRATMHLEDVWRIHLGCGATGRWARRWIGVLLGHSWLMNRDYPPRVWTARLNITIHKKRLTIFTTLVSEMHDIPKNVSNLGLPITGMKLNDMCTISFIMCTARFTFANCTSG